VGGRIIVQQEKISTTEGIWTNPLNEFQEAIHYSFIICCIYCFSFWYEFFVQCALRGEKNYQQGLDVGTLEFILFYVFLTVHHSIDLFHLPTLMHNSFIH